jgi:predicted acetyltransferase
VSIQIRAVDAGDIDTLLLADQRGFGGTPMPVEASRSWALGELERTRVAFEDGAPVGVSRTYTFELTMPGGALLPAAAVSWVSVLPTHRRRGVLTQMMSALHDDARHRNEPVAMLTASESVIYGRFGYGVAAWRFGLEAERARVEFDTTAGLGGSMRMATRAEAERVLPEIYDRVRRTRAGMVPRPSFWWPAAFWDHVAGSDKKAFFVAVHRDDAGADDGYVAYEINGEWAGGLPDRKLIVWDVIAESADTHVALWRYLFGVDLVGTLVATNTAPDDPLRSAVTDPRRVRVDFVNDGLWVAPLDVARALAARTYSIEGALVLEVHDTAGSKACYALDGGPTGARCTRTDREPDLVCPVQTVGATMLGGTKWYELAAVGRVEERTTGAIARADLMFSTSPAPANLSYF